MSLTKIMQSSLYKKFEENGFKISLYNQGHHWKVFYGRKSADFWPKKEKWKIHQNDMVQTGSDDLIKAMRSGKTRMVEVKVPW